MIFDKLNIFGSRTSLVRLPFTTDIHCHVLPGVDHGAKDADMACQLIKYQQNWGLNKIFFTPHVTDEIYPNDNTSINDAFDRFMPNLKGLDLKMKFGKSAEYRLDALFSQQLNANKLIPLPDNHLLIELPFLSPLPKQWLDSILFEIQSRGFKPILAHPERYVYLHSRDLVNYHELHDRHIEFQVNLLSLTGYHGQAEKQLALKLIDKKLVDYCATDLHHFRHTTAIDNYLSSRQCLPTLKKLAALIKNDKFNNL